VDGLVSGGGGSAGAARGGTVVGSSDSSESNGDGEHTATFGRRWRTHGDVPVVGS